MSSSEFDENQFIERLKEAVGEDTPTEFARKTGIAEDDAGLILSGDKELKGSELVRISSAYDVSVEWLLCRSERRGITGTSEADSAWLK